MNEQKQEISPVVIAIRGLRECAEAGLHRGARQVKVRPEHLALANNHIAQLEGALRHLTKEHAEVQAQLREAESRKAVYATHLAQWCDWYGNRRTPRWLRWLLGKIDPVLPVIYERSLRAYDLPQKEAMIRALQEDPRRERQADIEAAKEAHGTDQNDQA